MAGLLIGVVQTTCLQGRRKEIAALLRLQVQDNISVQNKFLQGVGGLIVTNATGVLTVFGETLGKVFSNHAAWIGGFFLGCITYLVDPGAPFYALWIVVACDLISRLTTESINHGGFIKAVKEGHISSDKAMRGTMVKIIAYFIMCIIAAQSKAIFPYDAAADLFGSIIYSILFFVEVLSIAENFMEAGVEEFNWLQRFTKRKLEKIVDDGEIKFNADSGNESHV